MARRPALVKIKKKKLSKSKNEQYAINQKAYGDEPIYTDKELSTEQLTKAFNWYNYMCDSKEAKEFLITYLKNAGRDKDAKAVRQIQDKWIVQTVCWIARMRSSGAKLPDNTIKYFETRLQESISDGQRRAREGQSDQEDNTSHKPKPATQNQSVYSKLKAQTGFQICLLEEVIDKFMADWNTGFNMYEWLEANEVSAPAAKIIHDFYNPQLLEIEEAFHGKIDGYDGYSKDQLKKLYGFFVMIVEDLELLMQNRKKVRKTRAKKPMSTEKKLKDFKYKEFDNIYKIQSAYPSGIIGAAELWAFNTKYNQLTVFRMDDPQVGLDVHRTAITKFDPSSSSTKKLRAKDVEDVLKEVLAGGKVALRKLMDNTRGTDKKLQERMNDNTVLLRIVQR